MTKIDRRVQRTQDLLQKALIELLREHRYEDITVQDIVDNANLGRTTFYLHYESKDHLLMSCHELIVRELHFGLLHANSREELLSVQAPARMTTAFQHLQDTREMLYPLFNGNENQHLLRQIREWSVHTIESNLRRAFTEANSTIPFDVLALYLTGAQLTLLHWWLEKPRTHTPEALAQTFHRLQRTAICDALGIGPIGTSESNA